jgi:hypothetical protein
MTKTPLTQQKVVMTQDWLNDDIIEQFTLLSPEIKFLGINDPYIASMMRSSIQFRRFANWWGISKSTLYGYLLPFLERRARAVEECFASSFVGASNDRPKCLHNRERLTVLLAPEA